MLETSTPFTPLHPASNSPLSAFTVHGPANSTLSMPSNPVPLTDQERDIWEWQMWVPDFGEAGQEQLKGASVLISRCGGVGGVVAYQLAAAGIGKLIIAHRGNIRPSDLNRQLLMTHESIGTPRVDSIRRRLKELNPRLEVVAYDQNVSESNAAELVEQADVIVDCAPLFEERFALNDQAVRLGKPMVECAMYELEARITTILPGETACLRCLYPRLPESWKRQFPVFGAVSSTVASIGAMETIKLIAGLGQPLANRLLLFDLRDVTFQTIAIDRDPNCPCCGNVGATDK